MRAKRPSSDVACHSGWEAVSVSSARPMLQDRAQSKLRPLPILMIIDNCLNHCAWVFLRWFYADYARGIDTKHTQRGGGNLGAWGSERICPQGCGILARTVLGQLAGLWVSTGRAAMEGKEPRPLHVTQAPRAAGRPSALHCGGDVSWSPRPCLTHPTR